MNKIDERTTQITEGKDDRRSFLKRIYKYAIGLSAFGFASVFGLRRSGEIRLGKMKDIKLGLSEAYGMCSSSLNCAGGGGQCSSSLDCAGGGGQCSSSLDCAGSGRPGGGGQCSSSLDCAGGGGQCSSSLNCAGS